MYSVSSGFISTAAQANAPWKRKFTLGGSDYSARVQKWPKVQRTWNAIKPGTVTIDLTNDDRAFNFFVSAPTNIKATGIVQLGFDYAVGSTEYITLFQGTVDAVQLREGVCKVTLADKFKQLADRLIGDQTTPTNYTGSSYLVHDLAWYFCTSHGGLSAIQSTSNPDIDWTSFNSWTSIWSTDNVRMKALVKGKKITEMLSRISDMTQSAIVIENNKVKFGRYSIADSPAFSLNEAHVFDTQLVIDEREIINRVRVSADYSTTSRSFAITVTQADSTSIDSYSLKEEIYDDDSIWFTDSVSALGTTQRVLTQYKNPYGRITAMSALSAAQTTVGDTITYTDSFYAIDQQSYRVMAEVINMDDGSKTFELDDTQLQSAFRLDISLLDGTDVLT